MGSHVLLSHIDVHDETIPDNVVLHDLKRRDERFVCRIYGVEDNPKENRIFGQELSEIIHRVGGSDSDLWDTDDHTLWMAKLYPECDTVKEAVAVALNVYNLIHGTGDIEFWKNTDRKSLCSGFGDADPAAIISWNQRMREMVRMDEITKEIRSGKPARETGRLAPLTRIQQEWFAKRYTRSDFTAIIRLKYYIGTALGGKTGDPYISDTILTDGDGSAYGEVTSLCGVVDGATPRRCVSSRAALC